MGLYLLIMTGKEVLMGSILAVGDDGINFCRGIRFVGLR